MELEDISSLSNAQDAGRFGKVKFSLLELAEYLNNISQACKMMYLASNLWI